MTEAEVRALVHGEPHDEVAWQVYADWLEVRGDDVAANVVRRHARLHDAIARASAEAVSIAREILTMAAPLPRAWLAELAAPAERLVGTCWGARDQNEDVYLVVFDADGSIHFVQGDVDEEPDASEFDAGKGAWMQIGRALTFSIFTLPDGDDYSRHDGYVAEVGRRLVGIGSDEGANTWSWELAPLPLARFAYGTPLPALPAEPADSQYNKSGVDALLPLRRWPA